MMRWLIGLGLSLAACEPEVVRSVELQHANARVPYQTDPRSVQIFATDLDQPYDVLADLEITLRQQGSLGEMPTKEMAIDELRKQAGRIGAHAIVMVDFGRMGLSFWSYNELRGHGRAIRFR
jgi:hypothetical protein